MDGGEKEKAVANSLKEIVKHTSRRKTATQSKQSLHSIKIAPKPKNGPTENSTSDSGSSQKDSVTPRLDYGPSRDDIIDDVSL
jgi:hypothetical protein